MHYINEAIDNEKAGLSIKPEKKEVMHCAVLKNALQTNIQLNAAFQQFTVYKQKEFWEYMATAKQEKTKHNRLEKIIPHILSGTGLNDKYK